MKKLVVVISILLSISMLFSGCVNEVSDSVYNSHQSLLNGSRTELKNLKIKVAELTRKREEVNSLITVANLEIDILNEKIIYAKLENIDLNNLVSLFSNKDTNFDKKIIDLEAKKSKLDKNINSVELEKSRLDKNTTSLKEQDAILY